MAVDYSEVEINAKAEPVHLGLLDWTIEDAEILLDNLVFRLV